MSQPANPASAQLVVQHQLQAHAGPLPHPDVLAGYEKTLPGAAERIFAMAERQQAHAQAMQSAALRADIEARDRDQDARRSGQWFAAILVVGALASGVYLTVAGHDWVGGTIMTTTIGAVLAAFLGTRSKDGEPPSE